MTTEWAPPARDRVRERSSEKANARIDHETQAAIEQASESPEAIRQRLRELDREWNVDRALMLNFAVVAGLSASMMMRNLLRKHRLGGWGAMFWTQIVFRRLGYRTGPEICAERVALEKQLDR
jgi:hypothetical protein